MNGAQAKTVLAISYVFPPTAYVGVHRILKYCKYLGLHGWRPIVVTPRRPGGYRDDRLSAEVPADVAVVKTGDIDPAKLLDRVGQWRRRRNTNVAPGSAARPADRASAPGTTQQASVLARMKQMILGTLLESPDSHLFWVPFALLRGAWVLLTQHVDVIYSSSPPHSTHLAALALASCFNKPYVLDFRDPWELGGPMPRVMKWLRRLVTSRAARVVTVSKGERVELLQEVPQLDPTRIVVITNGYDLDDFAAIQAPDRGDESKLSKLRMSHVGTIHRGAGGEFFDALELLLRGDSDLGAWLTVTLVGDVSSEYEPAVARLEGTGVVSRVGFLPKAKALEEAMGSDVLLILLGGDRFAPSELPAKLSEYLYIGKPILAVARRGELWEVLQNSRAGTAVPPFDPPALAAEIKRLGAEHRSNRRPMETDRRYIERFDRRALAAQFASVLDEVSGVSRC